MSEFAGPWADYERLQVALKRRNVDDVAWGLEVALNRYLVSTVGICDIRRTVESASRKERYHAELRRKYLPAEGAITDPDTAILTKEHLARAQEAVSDEDWNILRDVAGGETYGEMATRRKTTPGALRTRVSRIRQRCRRHRIGSAGDLTAC